jgi:hypothetical protein
VLDPALIRRATVRFTRARAYKRVLATPDGQIMFADMMQACRVAQPASVAGDPHQSAVNEGMRQAALHMARLAHMSDEDMLRLALEAEQGGPHVQQD